MSIQEEANALFARQCQFVAGVDKPSIMPPPSLPEIAFIGRSNVGKSSLINALVNRRALARTSNTPGRTQQLNFFQLNDQLLLVDLPGYGFAKVSKSKVADWTRLIHYYFSSRPSLKRVCVLIDGRHGLKPSDREMMHRLDEVAMSYQLIFTKCDKMKEKQSLMDELTALVAEHPALFPTPIFTSSNTRMGIEELRLSLYELWKQSESSWK